MINQHFFDCEKDRKQNEESYRRVFNECISTKLHRKASHTAIKKGKTLNQMIKQALEKELEEH